jgi:hypothetical protein
MNKKLIEAVDEYIKSALDNCPTSRQGDALRHHFTKLLAIKPKFRIMKFLSNGTIGNRLY